MGFHNFFPSKWFAMIAFPLLGIALIGGLFFLYQHDLQSEDTSGIAVESASQDLRQYVLESDQDKDGLPDWAENLWHTDPQNPDTDGDGTKDGDEVTRDRNPAIPGPNDVLDHISTSGTQTTSGTSTNASSSTVTTTVAQELFGSYLMLKQSGKFDQAAQGKLIEALSDSASKQINMRPYEISDLTTVPATPESIEAYGAKMADVFTQFVTIGKTRPNEIILLKQALESKDYSKLSTIAESAPIYENLSTQLRTMPVPQEIATDQLTLTNSFKVYADMDRAMAGIQQDPVKAIVYIGNYQTLEASGQKAMGNILSYLSTHTKK